MNKIKALMEKRNAKVQEKLDLLNVVKEETRAFTEEENEKRMALDKEIKDLDDTIKILNSERFDNAEEVIKEDVENMNEDVKVVNQEEMESLQLRNYMTGKPLANGVSEEVRAGSSWNPIKTTDDETKVLIPDNLADGIIKTMEHTSSIVARIEKLPSVKGKLTILSEDESINTIMSQGVEEGADATEYAKLKFGTVQLTEKRFVAMYKLTQQMINNAAFDIVEYCLNNLSIFHARRIEHDIFQGAGNTTSLKGLDSETAKIKRVTGAANGVVTYDELNEVCNSLFPDFAENAVWYMAPDFYAKVAKLKDGNGHYFVQNGVVNGKLTKTLFDFPIERSVHLSAQYPCYFGDMGKTYALMIKKGFELKHVSGDTTQSLAGTHLLLLDIFMDGAIKNPQAMVGYKNGV